MRLKVSTPLMAVISMTTFLLPEDIREGELPPIPSPSAILFLALSSTASFSSLLFYLFPFSPLHQ